MEFHYMKKSHQKQIYRNCKKIVQWFFLPAQFCPFDLILAPKFGSKKGQTHRSIPKFGGRQLQFSRHLGIKRMAQLVKCVGQDLFTSMIVTQINCIRFWLFVLGCIHQWAYQHSARNACYLVILKQTVANSQHFQPFCHTFSLKHLVAFMVFVVALVVDNTIRAHFNYY